jgi:hypothetical protein
MEGRVMLDRPFESRMAEIYVELLNLGAEMDALGTAVTAIERCTVDARSKFHAAQDRRQTLMADFAMLRADVRRAQ